MWYSLAGALVFVIFAFFWWYSLAGAFFFTFLLIFWKFGMRIPSQGRFLFTMFASFRWCRLAGAFVQGLLCFLEVLWRCRIALSHRHWRCDIVFVYDDSGMMEPTSTITAKPLNLVWWMSRIYHGFQVKSTMRVRISLVIVSVGTDHSQNEIWACNSKNSQRTVQFPMISWNGCKNAHFHSADILQNGGPNFGRLVLRAEKIFLVGVCFKS